MDDRVFRLKDKPDATWDWTPIELPQGFLQYVDVSWSNPLSASGHYVILALATMNDDQERPDDDPNVSDGHIIFRDIVYLKIATSGLQQFESRFHKQMYNLEILEPTRFWLGTKHNRGGTMSYLFTFRMTKEKLMEVV